jgi:hypothetical protein
MRGQRVVQLQARGGLDASETYVTVCYTAVDLNLQWRGQLIAAVMACGIANWQTGLTLALATSLTC